jgi:hypothetical protein
MALELFDRLAILVLIRRFIRDIGLATSNIATFMSVCNISFVALLPFRRFGGMSDENSRIWCGMPSCSSGLGFSLVSSFCFVVSTISCKKTLYYINTNFRVNLAAIRDGL